MLSTRIKGKIMPTSNKLEKINIRVTTSRYETSGKNNAHLLSCNRPTREKIIGASSILALGKSRVLPRYWNSSDFL